MSSVSASKSEDILNARGPTYKVDIDVNGIKTRGFLDHGAQVTLVRKELLPAIGEKHDWSLEERHKRNLKMKSQPVGASGTDLGAIALVSLDILVEETGLVKEIPCYVLSSEKPIWRGELYNCGVILGTNALVVLGFKVFHSNGTEVPAQCEPEESQPSVSVTSVLQVTVEKNVCLGPGQTRTVHVRVNDNRGVISLGVVTPSEAILAELQCDFVEQLWQQGEATPHVRAPPRRLPYALRSELEAELIKLEATGCIKASTSPYASGLVLVRKKDGGLRVCVDYRGINKDTIPDRYPIPCIDDLIDTVGR